MWFHFDFKIHSQLVRLAWGEPDPKTRRSALFKLLVIVPAVASFHAVCFMLDALLFPSLRKVQIEAPIFILGHARSGTTLLHRLMSEDEGRFSSFLTYEMHFPSLLQKKTIRAAARFDDRFLGRFFTRRVEAWEEKRYAPVRHIHEMGLTIPEEDDLVFYWSCASGFWMTEMPYMDELDFFDVDNWPEKRRRRLLRFYRDCIRRQLALNGDDKIHLCKSPVFAGRVHSLIEEFPDCRIVLPVRNPGETIPSLLKLLASGWKHMKWADERVNSCARDMVETSFKTYLYPPAALAQHPDTRSAIIDYRALVEDPAVAMPALYRELELPVKPEFQATLDAAAKRSAKRVSTHSYSLEMFGLEADVIRTRLAPLFDEFGWDEGAVASGGDDEALNIRASS